MANSIKPVDKSYFEERTQELIAKFQEEQEQKSQVFLRIRHELQKEMETLVTRLDRAEARRVEKEVGEFEQCLQHVNSTLQEALNVEESLRILRDNLAILTTQLPPPNL